MDSSILVPLGIELVRSLVNAAVALAKTLSVSDEELDATFARAKKLFDTHDPANFPGWGDQE